jgi:hypothetical protein
MIEPESSPEERALAMKVLEEFRKNVAWFGDHAREIRDLHSGKFICVAGQELFVGDDAAEVYARAKAAHPTPGAGFLTKQLSTHRGPSVSCTAATVTPFRNPDSWTTSSTATANFSYKD